MGDLFATPAMAAGYAAARPPVHPHIMRRVRQYLQLTNTFDQALDIGCGAGLSTVPLQPLARRCMGIDPSRAMLKYAASAMPNASFAVGRAEQLPVRSHSVNIITAAGSLNYSDLNLSLPEAARVLSPEGVLVVYDFKPGRSFRGSDVLDTWYHEFLRRYPPPAGSSHEISPQFLASYPGVFRLHGHEVFETGLLLNLGSYVDYVLTETNVAEAVRTSIPHDQITAWCTRTLAPVFGDSEHEILFRGYIAYLVPA